MTPLRAPDERYIQRLQRPSGTKKRDTHPLPLRICEGVSGVFRAAIAIYVPSGIYVVDHRGVHRDTHEESLIEIRQRVHAVGQMPQRMLLIHT